VAAWSRGGRRERERQRNDKREVVDRRRPSERGEGRKDKREARKDKRKVREVALGESRERSEVGALG
jgi:hypothetical protein